MRILAIVLSCLAAWQAAPAAAQVYKWVDEKGATHYGEKAPPNRKSKEVIIRDSGPRQGAEPGAAAAAATLKDKEIQFRQRQAQREQDEQKEAREKAAREQWCREARLHLHDLKATRRLYDLNDKGERVFMSDAERDATLAKREAELSQRCR